MLERPLSPAVIGVVLVVVIGLTGGPIAFADTSAAQTPVLVENDVTEDTTWETGSGPYRVVKSITVTSDTTLTIQPGVTVEVAEDVSITVEGNLRAVGERSNPVLFTASAAEPSPGAWDTLRLAGPEPTVSRLQHTTIEYATNGVTVDGAQQIQLENIEIAHSAEAGIRSTHAQDFRPTVEVQLTDSVVHRNTDGIRGHNGAFQVVDSKIANNSRAGIWLENTLNVLDVTVEGSTIQHNGVGITLRSSPDDRSRGGQISDVSITDSKVRENGGLGVEIAGYLVRDVTVTGAEIDSNGGAGLHVQDRGAAGESKPSGNIQITGSSLSDNGGAGLSMDASYSSLADVTLSDLTVSGNVGPGVSLGADVTTGQVSVDGLTVEGNGGDGISVAGTDETHSVTLTRSTLFWNAGDGVAVSGGNVSAISVVDSVVSRSGDAGVRVSGGQGDVRTHVTDNRLSGNGHGVVIENHQTNITDNVIEYNNGTAVGFDGAGSRSNNVHQNDIYENGEGLVVPEEASRPIADATNNYWGATSGPFHSSVNPEGEGNPVNGGLETLSFIPYAEAAFIGTHERPTPKIRASATTVENGSEVTFSGADSTDDGSVEWYQFHYNDSTSSEWMTTPEVTRRYEQPGNYTVGVTVIDDRGVDGNETATVTIRVVESPTNETTTESGSNNGGNGGSGNGNDTPTTEPNGENETFVPGLGFPVAIAALLVAFVLYGRFGNR